VDTAAVAPASLANDLRAVLVQRVAELGRLGASRRTAQELRADRLLEELEPLADVRARGVEAAGGGAQAPGVDDLDEELEGV
jgi:hypothetical protein